MNVYELIALAIVFIGMGSAQILLWAKFKTLEGKLVLSEQQVANDKITADIHNLTDDALKLVTEAEFGPTTSEPSPSVDVPKQNPN